MGVGNFPDEIWVILIDSWTCETAPKEPAELVDRRNEMIGNMSLLQDVLALAAVGRIFERNGFTEELLDTVGDTNPEYVKFRVIPMSKEVHKGLDYPSKLSRAPAHVKKLIEHGEEPTREFLDNLAQPAHTIEELACFLTGEV